MKLAIKKEVSVEAKTISIHCKVTDGFCAQILDQDAEVIYDQEDGYVWDFMPGNHYGDYVILEIDIETGQITNWKKPAAEDIQTLINGDDND